jgi:hypothetical protein
MAEALEHEAEEFRDYAEIARKAGGFPGTAQPRPSFSADEYHSLVRELDAQKFLRWGMVNAHGLLVGDYNNLSYAQKMSEEIRMGQQKDQATPAKHAAEALEGAAKALRQAAAFGFLNCIQEA